MTEEKTITVRNFGGDVENDYKPYLTSSAKPTQIEIDNAKNVRAEHKKALKAYLKGATHYGKIDQMTGAKEKVVPIKMVEKTIKIKQKEKIIN